MFDDSYKQWFFELNNKSRLIGKLRNLLGSNSPIDILAYFHLGIDGQSFSITGQTELLSVTYHLDIEKNTQFSLETLIEGKRFADILATVDEGKVVDIKIEDQYAHLHFDRSNFQLKILDGETYPMSGACEQQPLFSIKEKNLKLILDRLLVALADEDTNRILNHAAFQLIGNELHALATDGHKFVSTRTIVDCKHEPDEIQWFLNKKTVSELRKILESGSETDLVATLDEGKLCLVGDDFSARCRTAFVQYPNVEKIISETDNTCEFTIDKDQLKSTLKKVDIIQDGRFKNMNLLAENDDQQIEFKAKNKNNEIFAERLACELTADTGVDLVYNAQYWHDAISLLDNDKVFVEIKKVSNNVWLRESRDSYPLFVISPMRG